MFFDLVSRSNLGKRTYLQIAQFITDRPLPNQGARSLREPLECIYLPVVSRLLTSGKGTSQMISKTHLGISTVYAQCKAHNFFAEFAPSLLPSSVDPVCKSVRRILPIIAVPAIEDYLGDRLRKRRVCCRCGGDGVVASLP
jgi:hypothetical protein